MKSVVLDCRIQIQLSYSQSLKEKRQIRYKIRDRLKSKFNVSIAETDYQDDMKFLMMRLAYVALSESRALEQFQKINELLLDICDQYQGLLEIDYILVEGEDL